MMRLKAVWQPPSYAGTICTQKIRDMPYRCAKQNCNNFVTKN